MYQATTHGIRVTAEPFYLEEQSDPEAGRYFWAYRITIENGSAARIKLVNRHWVITDGRGRIQEVRGDGVVGEQPELSPGDSYQYTSGCPLETTSGVMEGSYGMVQEDGSTIEVAIPAFSLDLPGQREILN